MKKLTYYVAAFALCCGVSQTLTSCVDETEEPDYVKAVREAEMKAEIAENEKNAKIDGKEAAAAFTTASLDGLTAKEIYEAYEEVKTCRDFADRQLAQAIANKTNFYACVQNRKEQQGILEDQLKSAKKATATLADDVDATTRAKTEAYEKYTESKKAAYDSDEGFFPFSADGYFDNELGLTLPYAYTSEPISADWATIQGNYLYCKQAKADADALFAEIEEIYKEAITAQKTANN
ncbi:MAG: hypothetical protein J6V76_07830 [Bacteroidales bacterium]|nr:hypothetical protein [Bacteroidales bacterium]